MSNLCPLDLIEEVIAMLQLMSKERALKFYNIVLEVLSGRVAFILTQPDPDAIDTLKVLKEFCMLINPGLHITMFAGGQLGHPQNIMIVKEMGLEFEFHPIANFNAEQFNHFVLVDSCEIEDSRIPGLVIPRPTIIIDHHPHDNMPVEEEHEFFHIEKIGACATILFEIVEHLRKERILKFKWEDPEFKDLGTLLALAIYTDTGFGFGGFDRDHNAFAFLKRLDPRKLADLVFYELPRAFFQYQFKAHANAFTYDGKLVTVIDFVDPQLADIVSILADEYLRLESARTAYVAAIVPGGIRISARNNRRTVDFSKELKEMFDGRGGSKPTYLRVDQGGAFLVLTPPESMTQSAEQRNFFIQQTLKDLKLRIFGEGIEGTPLINMAV